MVVVVVEVVIKIVVEGEHLSEVQLVSLKGAKSIGCSYLLKTERGCKATVEVQ